MISSNAKESIQEKGVQSSSKLNVWSVKITFLLTVTDPLITPMLFIFLSCYEKAHDNKEFSLENPKPH